MIELPREDKTLHVFHSDRDWHAIGWFHWPMWLAHGNLYFDPILFSRDTGQKVINCKQARTSCCLVQAESQVTKHHVYGWISVMEDVFYEEQIKLLMYRSIFARSHCPGDRGFKSEIFYSSERKMQELFYLFQRNRRQLEKQVFLCCFISIFAKTVMSTVSLITYTIFAISVILIKFSGHPRVVFADAKSSLKF